MQCNFFIVIIANNERNLICITPFENCVKSSADISGKPQCLLMWLFFIFCVSYMFSFSSQLYLSSELYKNGGVGYWPRDIWWCHHPDYPGGHTSLPSSDSRLQSGLVRTNMYISLNYFFCLCVFSLSSVLFCACSYLYPDGRDVNPDLKSLCEPASRGKVKVTEVSGCNLYIIIYLKCTNCSILNLCQDKTDNILRCCLVSLTKYNHQTGTVWALLWDRQHLPAM